MMLYSCKNTIFSLMRHVFTQLIYVKVDKGFQGANDRFVALILNIFRES